MPAARLLGVIMIASCPVGALAQTGPAATDGADTGAAAVVLASPLASSASTSHAAALQAADPAPSPAGSAPEPDDDVTLVISPYLWLPVVDGLVGGTEPGAIGFEIDTGELLDSFEFGGLIHGELRHASGWGVSVDYMFADLSNTSDIGVGLDTAVDASILEATVLRRIALGRNALDLYGGVRRWDSEVVIDVDTGLFPIQILTGDTWTDPIAGARYHHALSDRWQLLAQGDIGGFGVDSDFTWHAVLGVSYKAGRRTSLEIAYKRLSVARQSPRIGGGPPVDLDLTVQGPLVGFSWRF